MLPLENVRVLGLAHSACGQSCAIVLGDLGAEVIRVEQVIESDPTPARNATSAEWGTELGEAHEAPSRNKRSIALDFRRAEARKMVYSIAESADVLVEDLRPGIAVRLGIDYQTLQKINPRLVHCAICEYDQRGPHEDMTGHPMNHVAMIDAQRGFGRSSPDTSCLIADYCGGLYATTRILTALLGREKTGRGQYVEITIADTVLPLELL